MIMLQAFWLLSHGGHIISEPCILRFYYILILFTPTANIWANFTWTVKNSTWIVLVPFLIVLDFSKTSLMDLRNGKAIRTDGWSDYDNFVPFHLTLKRVGRQNYK